MAITPTGRPAWSRSGEIGDYDAALDKKNSAVEGVTPRAWIWYSELRAQRGSAYRTERDGLVHAEHVAISRSEAARTRAAEKLVANSTPGTSDEKLDRWVSMLGVPRIPGESRQARRQRAAAKFRLSTGPTIQNVDESTAEVLGQAFVRVWRQEGASLDSPPAQTFWPGVNPGPAGYSLGRGAWLSERANYVVEVQRPAGMSSDDYQRLVNLTLFRHLDDTLPAWSTFNAAEGLVTGFVLDVSALDFVGVTT